MSVLCFNCRGLGESLAVSDLCGLLRRLSSKVVFLSEIKRSKEEMANTVQQLGDFTGIYVDARGRSRGLTLLWDSNVNVQLLSLSLNHIDTSICPDGEYVTWHFTGFMVGRIRMRSGKLDKWSQTLQLIQPSRGWYKETWIRSFTMLKKGGAPKSFWYLDNFRNAFIDCGLFYLGYSGYDFTWCKYQSNGLWLKKSLTDSRPTRTGPFYF